MIKRLYYSVFGHEAPVSGIFFMQKLKEAGFGFAGSSLLGFLLTVSATRFLGPAPFGEVQYLLSLSSVLMIFPLLGIHFSMVKLLSKDTEEVEERKIVSSSMGFLLVNFLLFSLIISVWYRVGFPFLADYSASFFGLLLLFSFFFAFRALFQSILQSQEQFRLLSLLSILSALAALLFFLVFSFFLSSSFLVYFSALLLSPMSFCVLFLLKKRRFFLSASRSCLQRIPSFYQISLPAFFAVFLGVLFQQIDKLLIQAFFDAEQLGIYMAYLSLAFLIVSLPTTILIQVIMPSFATKTMTPVLMRMIKKSLLLGFPVIFGISLLVMQSGEILYGALFEVPFSFQILFSGYAFFYGAYAFLTSIFSVTAVQGFKKFAIMNGLGVFLLSIGFFLFTPAFGLSGVLLAELFTYFFISLGCFMLLRRDTLKAAVEKGNLSVSTKAYENHYPLRRARDSDERRDGI